MSEVIAYLDPSRVDKDRAAVRLICDSQGHRVVEEHIGGLGLAQISADALKVPLITAEGVSASHQHTSDATIARRTHAAERNAHLAKRFREAKLLGITSKNGIANYFTEQKVPFATGKVGRWSIVQVTRALKWIDQP